MTRIALEIPEETMAALKISEKDIAVELRMAAAVKWYELKTVSQERAAHIAGLSRAEFIDALGRFGVSPFQYGPDEILEEADRE